MFRDDPKPYPMDMTHFGVGSTIDLRDGSQQAWLVTSNCGRLWLVNLLSMETFQCDVTVDDLNYFSRGEVREIVENIGNHTGHTFKDFTLSPGGLKRIYNTIKEHNDS